MKVFSAQQLGALVSQAEASPRLRQHQNIHTGFDELCQRLFNAIEPNSYIRPHRHSSVPRDELLVAVRELMALVTFDEAGRVERIVRFGSEKYGVDLAVCVEVTSDTWHTVLALVPGSILLEVKAGPYDPAQPKESAIWAPPEGSSDAQIYVNQLRHLIDIHK